MLMELKDRDGRVFRRSNSMLIVVEYAKNNSVLKVAADQHQGYVDGKLCVLFHNGANFECNFASFDMLKQWVHGWADAYGAQLFVNGKDCGELITNHPSLK